MVIPNRGITNTVDAVKQLVLNNPSAKDLYSAAGRLGVKPEELLEAVKREGFNMKQPQLVPSTGFLGLPKIMPADPNTAGYIGRTAGELEQLLKTKARNRKLLMAGGLAGLLSLAGYMAFSNKPEDRYKKEVERLMKAHKMINSY